MPFFLKNKVVQNPSELGNFNSRKREYYFSLLVIKLYRFAFKCHSLAPIIGWNPDWLRVESCLTHGTTLFSFCITLFSCVQLFYDSTSEKGVLRGGDLDTEKRKPKTRLVVRSWFYRPWSVSAAMLYICLNIFRNRGLTKNLNQIPNLLIAQPLNTTMVHFSF